MKPMCPQCGGKVPNEQSWGQYPGAMSRRNGQEICSSCGLNEALDDFFGQIWDRNHGLTIEEDCL